MVAYMLAGMSWFDALGHSFSTVAIGGFSTHDASIGYFNSAAIELICISFMLISAFSFSLHFIAWREKRLLHYFQTRKRAFMLFLAGLTTITVITLWLTDTYDDIAGCAMRCLRLSRSPPPQASPWRTFPGAGRTTVSAVCGRFCRRMLRLYRWGDEGHPYYPDLETGHARSHAAHSPQCRDCR